MKASGLVGNLSERRFTVQRHMRDFTFDELLLNVRLADVLDVLFVAFIVYVLLRWLTKRSAHGVAAGAAFVLAAYALAQVTGMYLTLEIFRLGLMVIVVSLVIVFQQDIRQDFERLTVWRPFRSTSSSGPTSRFFNTLAEAVAKLAEEKSGALIVLKGRQPLERHTRGGILAAAELSIPLLHSIFNRYSQGHDGAVVIDNERVESFGVHLPLSKDLHEVAEGGTRHAAALGLSERTDALVIVVSEERGSISLADGSHLTTLDSPAQLQEHLESFYARRSGAMGNGATKTHPLRRLGLQGLALAIAVGLWFVFAFRIDTVHRNFSDVAIEFRNLPEDWRIEQVEPPTARLTLAGPERAFAQFDPADLSISVVPQTLREGERELTITDDNLDLPDGLQLRSAEPPTIRVQMHRYVRATLPIRVQTTGELPEPLRLESVTATPGSFPVLVRRNSPRIESLETDPIDMSKITETTVRGVDVKLPEGVLKTDAPPAVTVEIRVQPK